MQAARNKSHRIRTKAGPFGQGIEASPDWWPIRRLLALPVGQTKGALRPMARQVPVLPKGCITEGLYYRRAARAACGSDLPGAVTEACSGPTVHAARPKHRPIKPPAASAWLALAIPSATNARPNEAPARVVRMTRKVA